MRRRTGKKRPKMTGEEAWDNTIGDTAGRGAESRVKILFLHGWHSVVGGVKPACLKNAGHAVINPALDDDDFDLAVRTAQAAYDQHLPNVVIGSSRGGAVAMNIDSGDTPCFARHGRIGADALKVSCIQ